MQFLRMDIGVLQGAMSAGALSARQLTLEAFGQIAQLDRGPSGHNAVLTLNPDALFWADRMDELRRKGQVLGPLHGIPVLLKANISTRDGMSTSAGALALADNYARFDAEIVRRLRKAGAVILGKTNMTEFANYVSEEMPNGYSSQGGQVKGVFEEVDPSGSSTGSAVAVALGYCPGAVGTETCGSIISPATQAGIVGLKPTLGLCSRRGIIPISHTLDTAGPFARSVRDAALLLGVLAGEDSEDPAVVQLPLPDYAAALSEDLTGLRVGLSRLFLEEAVPGQLEAAQWAARLLEKQGAVCVPLEEEAFSCRALGTIMCQEFRQDLERYLREFGQGSRKTLSEIIQWNQSQKETAIPYGQEYLEKAQAAAGNFAEPGYLAALAQREAVIQQLDRTFEENQVDVILILSGACGHPALAGFPDITVPLGRSQQGDPLAALLMARRFEEPVLLKAAYGLEQAILTARR